LKEKRKKIKEEGEAAIEQAARKEEEMKEHIRLKSLGVDDGQLQRQYVKESADESLKDYRRQQRFNKIDAKRTPLLQVEYARLTKMKDFDTLKKKWGTACTMDEDLERLKVVKEKAIERKAWNGREQTVESCVAKRMDIGAAARQKQNEGMKHSGPSPMAIAAKERAYRKMEEKRNRGKKPLTELEKALRTVDETKTGFKYEAAQAHDNLKKGLDAAEAEVISKIIEYEGYVASIKGCLERSMASYKKARVVAIRQKSFDELTAMLGQPRHASKGFLDWQGQYTKGLVVTTVELIESVNKWREAVLMAEGKFGARNEYGDLIDHGDPLPFMWSGRNVLLEIPYNLQFVTKCREFVDWYGNDFKFERNPFMMALNLDDRPITPVKGTRTQVVDGVEVEQVSKSLGEKAQKQQDYWDHCQRIFDDGGVWWPSSGGKAMDEHLRRRVRAGEKVLLAEERCRYGNQFCEEE